MFRPGAVWALGAAMAAAAAPARAGAAGGARAASADGASANGQTTAAERPLADAADGTVMIDDELGEIGPDAQLSAGELATGANDASATRVETLALALVGAAIDAVQDLPPVSEPGFAPAGEDIVGFRLHARAEATGRRGDWLKVKVAGRFDAELTLDANARSGVERYQAQVWDTHVDLYGDGVDLRLGKQLLTWGTADLLTPNDVINARDLRRGLLERPEELRIPVAAAAASLYGGPLFAQAVWVPVAPVSRFELLDGDHALLGPSAATAVERRVGGILSALRDDPTTAAAADPLLAIGDAPDRGLASGELGGVLGLRLRKLDLYGYGFWGHERTPRVAVAAPLQSLLAETPADRLTAALMAGRIGELAASGVSPVEVDYPRRVHLGGALALRIEPLGVKLDVGYDRGATTLLVPPGGGLLLATPVARDQVSGTLSVDYDRGDALSIVAEGNLTRVLALAPGQRVYQLDGDTQLLLASQVIWSGRSRLVSFRVLGFVALAGAPSYGLRPAIRMSGHDRLWVELAGTLYGGPPASLGGVQANNDELQIVVQYGL